MSREAGGCEKREAEGAERLPSEPHLLRPPAIGALSHRFFCGGKVPLLKLDYGKSGYPYSNPSTGEPGLRVIWGKKATPSCLQRRPRVFR